MHQKKKKMEKEMTELYYKETLLLDVGFNLPIKTHHLPINQIMFNSLSLFPLSFFPPSLMTVSIQRTFFFFFSY